jgi:CRP/FNR family transcriptional regulator
MKQEDIGSHLGLTNETVSRTLSALCDLGLMKKNNRQIDILDFDALMKFRRLPANMNYGRNRTKSVSYS